jgi:hypothetical protein
LNNFNTLISKIIKLHLHSSFFYKLGKGTVFLWHDQWLEHGSAGSLIDFVNVIDSDLQVKDLWLNGAWDFCGIVTAM